MDLATSAFLGLVAVMAVNQLVMRIGGLKSRPAIFYSMQLLNLVTGSAVIWFGMPGFTDLPIVGWMIGLLFLLRIVQNNAARVEYLRERKADDGAEERREQIRNALRRGEE